MTAQGMEFLETWIAKNVTAADQGEGRAAILVTQCILEASAQGLHFNHLEIEEEDLERVIMDTAAHLADPDGPGD